MAKGNGSIGDSEIAVERELPCELTEAELLERGEAQAAAELSIEKLKVERRELNRAINVEIDTRNKLAHVVDSGEEVRKVVCKWIADFDHNQWNLVRQDTGAHVESRTMTVADRQAGLLFPTDLDAAVPAAEAVTADADRVSGEYADDDADNAVEVDGDTEVLEKKKPKRAKPSVKGKTKGRTKGRAQRAHA